MKIITNFAYFNLLAEVVSDGEPRVVITVREL